MTRKLRSLLEKCGLTEKEAEVYLSLCKLGESAPQDIAADTGLIRGTVHFNLGLLAERGYAMSRPHQTRTRITLYRAVDPSKLHQDLNETGRDLADSIPEIRSLNARSQGVLSVEHYQGFEGIVEAWDVMLDTGEEQLCYFSQNYMIETEHWTEKTELRDKVEAEYMNQRLSNQQWIKGLIPYEPNAKLAKELGIFESQRHQLIGKLEGANLLRDYAIIPRLEYPVEQELVVSGDKVSFTSYQNGTCTVITSAAFAQHHRLKFYKEFEAAKLMEGGLISKADQEFIRSYVVETAKEPS